MTRPAPSTVVITCTLLGLTVLSLGCDQESAESGGGPAPRAGAATSPAVPVKARSGDLILSIGDSLGVTGTYPYPQRLLDKLSESGDYELANIAEPGTTSADWLPGEPLFEDRLRPQLEGERRPLILVTLGGNDLEAALGGANGPNALSIAAANQAYAVLERTRRRIGENLAELYGAIRQANPKAVIVYVTYPDYAGSTYWQEAAGALGVIGLQQGLVALRETAAATGPDLLIDLLDPTAEANVDRLLSDGEHLSEAGHAYYAKAIAEQIAP